jgi:hypothetical protein
MLLKVIQSAWTQKQASLETWCLCPVQGSNRNMEAAQIQDRRIATSIAAGACDADTSELQRLTKQTEELLRWLQ